MAFSKKDFQRVFKKVIGEVRSCKYDNWSFIQVRYKKMNATLGNFFFNNDLMKMFTKNPTFLQYIKFDGYGKPVSLRAIFADGSVPKELLKVEKSVLNGVFKVTLSLPYWILYRKLYKIYLNQEGLSTDEQMKKISELYGYYCVEGKMIKTVSPSKDKSETSNAGDDIADEWEFEKV